MSIAVETDSQFTVADCIFDTATNYEATADRVRETVRALTEKYPIC